MNFNLKIRKKPSPWRKTLNFFQSQNLTSICTHTTRNTSHKNRRRFWNKINSRSNVTRYVASHFYALLIKKTLHEEHGGGAGAARLSWLASKRAT